MIPKSQSQSSIFDRGKSTSHGLFRSECESEFCTTTSTRQNDSSNSNKEKNCSRTFICNNGVKKIVPVSRSSGNFKSVYGSPSHETPGNEKYAEKCALLSERDQKRFAHQNENPTQGSQLCCSQTDSKSNMFWCNEKNKSFAVEITTSQCRNKSDQCTWTNIGNSGVRGEERDAVFNRQDFLSSDRQSKILTAKNQRSGQNYYFNSEFGSSTRHPMQMILHSDKSNQHQTTYKDFSVQADKTIFITPKENHHHRDFHLGLIDSSQGLPMNRTGPDSQYWAIKTHPKNFITDFTCKTGDAQNSYRNLRLEKCIVAHLDHGEVDFSQATLDSKSRIRHGTELPESYTSHSYNGLEYYRIGSICGTPLPAASCSPEPLSSYTSMYAGRVSSARSTRSRSYWSRVTSTRSISRVSNFRTHSGEIGNGYKTLRQTTRKKLVDGNERHVLSGTGFYTETPRTLKGEAGEGEGGVENENKSKSNIISASTCSSWDESQCSKKISQRFSPVKTKTRAFSNVDRPIASLIEARGSSVDPDLGNHWRSRFRTSADSVSLRSALSITRSSLVSTENESRSGESRSLGTNTHRSGMQRSLSAENYFLRMAFSAGARQYDKHLRECRPNDKTCVEGAFRRRAEETKKTQTETDSSETIRKEYKGVGTHRSEEGAKQEREEEKRLNGGEKARDNKVKKGDEKLKTDGEARPKQIEGKEKLKVYDKVKPKKKGMGAEKLEADEEISPKKKGKGAEKLEADEEISPKKKGKGAEKLYADEEISPEKKGKDAEKLYVDEEISPKKKGKGAEKLEADEAATPKKKGKSAGKLEADEEVSSKKKKAGGKLKVDDEVKPKKKGKDAGKLKIDEEERPDQEEESEELEEEKDARPKKTGKEHEQFKLNEETRPKGKDAEDGKKVEGGIPKRQEIEQDKTKDSRARKENEEKRVSKNEQGKAMRDREEGLRDDRPRRQKEDHTRKYAEQELGSEVERGDSNTEINQNKQTDTTYPKQKKAVPDSAGKKKTVEKKETQVSPRQVKTHQIKPTNSIIYDAALKFFRATGMTYFATVLLNQMVKLRNQNSTLKFYAPRRRGLYVTPQPYPIWIYPNDPLGLYKYFLKIRGRDRGHRYEPYKAAVNAATSCHLMPESTSLSSWFSFPRYPTSRLCVNCRAELADNYTSPSFWSDYNGPSRSDVPRGLGEDHTYIPPYEREDAPLLRDTKERAPLSSSRTFRKKHAKYLPYQPIPSKQYQSEEEEETVSPATTKRASLRHMTEQADTLQLPRGSASVRYPLKTSQPNLIDQWKETFRRSSLFSKSELAPSSEYTESSVDAPVFDGGTSSGERKFSKQSVLHPRKSSTRTLASGFLVTPKRSFAGSGKSGKRQKTLSVASTSASKSSKRKKRRKLRRRRRGERHKHEHGKSYVELGTTKHGSPTRSSRLLKSLGQWPCGKNSSICKYVSKATQTDLGRANDPCSQRPFYEATDTRIAASRKMRILSDCGRTSGLMESRRWSHGSHARNALCFSSPSRHVYCQPMRCSSRRWRKSEAPRLSIVMGSSDATRLAKTRRADKKSIQGGDFKRRGTQRFSDSSPVRFRVSKKSYNIGSFELQLDAQTEISSSHYSSKSGKSRRQSEYKHQQRGMNARRYLKSRKSHKTKAIVSSDKIKSCAISSQEFEKCSHLKGRTSMKRALDKILCSNYVRSPDSMCIKTQLKAPMFRTGFGDELSANTKSVPETEEKKGSEVDANRFEKGTNTVSSLSSPTYDHMFLTGQTQNTIEDRSTITDSTQAKAKQVCEQSCGRFAPHDERRKRGAGLSGGQHVQGKQIPRHERTQQDLVSCKTDTKSLTKSYQRVDESTLSNSMRSSYLSSNILPPSLQQSHHTPHSMLISGHKGTNTFHTTGSMAYSSYGRYRQSTDMGSFDAIRLGHTTRGKYPTGMRSRFNAFSNYSTPMFNNQASRVTNNNFTTPTTQLSRIGLETFY